MSDSFTGLAGLVPPSSELEMDEVTVRPEDDRPWLVKAAGALMPESKAKERLKTIPYSKQQRLNEETFFKIHGDVLKERLGNFEGRERMGDSLDNAHNSRWNIFYNKWHKDGLRDAFENMGIKRKN